jgi:hypothetical protein
VREEDAVLENIWKGNFRAEKGGACWGKEGVEIKIFNSSSSIIYLP